MTWYCIRTERRAELSLVAELRDLGLTAYVPVEAHDRKVRGRKQRITVPAFQGYAFVDCEPRHFDDVLACDGAFDFVRYQGESRDAAEMPRHALASVFLAEIFGALDHTIEPAAYKPGRGDSVVVKSGMWRGKIGLIISVGKRKSLLQPLDGFGKWNVKNEDLELAA